MKKVYYERRVSPKGRVTYVPVAEYDSEWVDSFPKGNHLVMCYPGGSSRKFNIDPDFAPMIAAGRYAEQAMCNAVMEGSKARPEKQPLTKAQQEAWKVMNKAFGKDMFYIQYPSAAEAVDAGLKAMQVEADKMLQNPTLRKAYDNFITLCKLVHSDGNPGTD